MYHYVSYTVLHRYSTCVTLCSFFNSRHYHMHVSSRPSCVAAWHASLLPRMTTPEPSTREALS